MGLVIKKHTTKALLAEKTAARRKRNAAEARIVAVACSSPMPNDLIPALKIKRIPIAELKMAKRRVRNAGNDHVANVAQSIRTAGQVAPILVDRNHYVIDGHVVVDAIRSLGAHEISVICLDHLTDDQIKFLQIALNKLAEGSTWDLDKLGLQLGELQLAGYDLTGTGFSLPELDIILQPEPAAISPEAEGAADPPSVPVSQLNDLWQLGDHRLLCGDALDGRSYAQILGAEKADVCFTDCPWNIPIKGFVSSKHQDFKMAAGEMSEEAFQTFVDTFTKLIAENLDDGAVLYSCIDWRSHDKIVLAGERAGLAHINTIVWNKGCGGMGGFYRSAHELIPLFCRGNSPKTNNIQLGRHGRDRTNVWTYPGANRPGSSAEKALKHHPTPKPIEMVEDALLDATAPGALVLDPFMGSGTTLLAATRSGRIAVGIELDPAYVDVAIRRWEEMTGDTAVLAADGATFREVEASRSAGFLGVERGE